MSWTIPEGLENRSNLLWVNIVARDLASQKAYARGSNQIQVGREELGRWKILAPNEFSEDTNHEWGEYESVSTRLAQKVGDINKAVSEYGGVKGGVTGAGKQMAEGGGSVSAEQGMAVLRAGAAGAAGANVPQYKIDTSFVYQNSTRRTYQLTFNISQYRERTEDLEQKLFRPIRELQRLSCPTLTDDLISIGFPAVFRVYSTPFNVINITHAALTAVQPTWKGPYKNGVPTMCDLLLTFTDISPLYRRSFEQGGIIRTS